MAKFIRLSDDAVFVFCAYGVFPARRFSNAAFFHTRAYVHVSICAPAHTCATHAHLLLAREERNFSCRRFMIVLRSFSSGELQKSKTAEFSWKNSAEALKIRKKREIRLETAEKRLFAAMKGRYSSERTVKRRKPAKKRRKRKKTKKN